MRKSGTESSTTEIERKFLLREIPFSLEEHPRQCIQQGYLCGTDPHLHIRIRKSTERYTLTIKHGAGILRTEVELDLSPDQVEALWPLTEGRRLEKVRYTVPLTRFGVEIDVYEGALSGLVVCEVEFGTLDDAESFTPPDWFGEEVTSDARYGNFSLARAQEVPTQSQ